MNVKFTSWSGGVFSRFIFMNLIIFLTHCDLIAGSFLLTPGVRALDVPIDPQSVALAESFVAMRGTLGALKYNPATLSGFQGLKTSYSKRNFNPMQSRNDYYESYQLAVSTPLGGIGFFYDHFSMHEMPVTTPAFPEGTGQFFTAKNFIYGIAWGKTLTQNIDAGISIKAYNETFFNITGKTTYLLDAGIIYHAIGPFSQTDIFNDEISGGLSIQNVGSEIDYGLSSNETYTLPRYTRIGFAYSFTVLNENKANLSPYKFQCTGEYRNLLNATDNLQANRDYWGFGTEWTLYEILSLRVGGFIPASSGVYGAKGSPAYRYGFGLSLPLSSINPDFPLVFHFDYAAIPVNSSSSYSYYYDNTTFHVFSIGITYNNSVF